MGDESIVTPEMEAAMIQIRDKWIKIGLDCTPADRPRAEAGLRAAYEVAELEPPKEIHWVSSPYQGVILAAQWVVTDDMQPWGSPKLKEVSKDHIVQALGISCYGQHDAGWHAFYEFLQPYLPEKISKLEPQREIAKSGHWWWPFENGAIISDRPSDIKVDSEGRLHCITGPAITYRDEFRVYAYHGTSVPPEAVENPKGITAQMIQEQSDSVLKKALAEMAPTAIGILAKV